MKHQIELFMDNRRYTIIQNEASHSEHWKHTEPKISKSTMLPDVLIAPVNGNSISMVRALRQVKELLENNIFDPTTTEEASFIFLDKLHASFDDIDTMIAAIK